MPPTLALFLCSIFIFYLLIRDSKNNPEASAALWVPLIWMMIIGSRMISYWFNVGKSLESPDKLLEGSPMLEGSPVDRTIFMGLIILSIIILLRRRIAWSTIVRSNVWIIVFIVYCGISVLWSEFPGVALKRYIKALGNYSMILVVLTDRNPIEAVKTMIRRSAYVLIPLSIVLYKYYPTLGRSYHVHSGKLYITGVATSKSALGVLCMICGVYFFWYFFKVLKNKGQRKIDLIINGIVFFMIVWFLVVADSATSLSCFLLGVIILWGLEIKSLKNKPKRIWIYFLIILLILFNIQYVIGFSEFLRSSLGRETTLTGRTEIWSFLLNVGTDPLFGTGYGSFWLENRLESIVEKFGWMGNEAHNGYLELYLELGIIGVFLMVGFIISSYRNIIKRLESNYEYGKLGITFFVVTLVYNITESGFRDLMLIYFVFLLMTLRIQKNKDRTFCTQSSPFANQI